MAKTQAVNFRADSVFYQKTKDILADEKITVSDVLNAALRKIANRTVDAREFVSSDVQDTQYQVAFEDLKKKILVGHQEIIQGKVSSLADARKEFGLDQVGCDIVSLTCNRAKQSKQQNNKGEHRLSSKYSTVYMRHFGGYQI